jgi:RHS repeat-associated protein
VETIVSSNAHGVNELLTYDSLNRLATVVDNNLPAGSNTTSYTYDDSSNVATVSYPNGLTSTFTFDTQNRLTELSTASSGTAVADYKYTLSPTELRTGVTEQSGRTLNWNYDGIYRLTNETVANDPAQKDGSVAYTLDPVGNRTAASSTLSGVSSSSTPSYNPDDELATESYDANGNTISSGGKTYAYDSENRLTSANGGAVSIVYDAFGNRVAKTVNGITTQYLVEDDVNPTGLPQVFDEVVNGAVTRTYTYGFQRVSENQQISNVWTPSFYGYDGGGTVRQLTNSAGQVTDTYDYDAFGNLIHQSGTTPNNYLYRGEQWDPDLSVYYLRHRYYNPLTDRFLSRDPKAGHIGIPRMLHKYLYASGDGVNRVDPRGTEDFVEEENTDTEAEKQTAGLQAIARWVECVLNTTTDLLTGVIFLDEAVNAKNAGQFIAGAAGTGVAVLNISADITECMAEVEVKPTGCCFARGTPVHTDHGDVPIENIHEGDEVESRNRATGKVEYKRVTALTPQHQDSLIEMRIQGERTPLHPTSDHPFWIERGGALPQWMPAGEMRTGDFVQSIAGAWRRVVSITPVEGQETVYNFTVDKDHDYFVGETGFLVHNDDCPCKGGGQPTWPDNAQDMSDMLGTPGTPKPDGPYIGRNKTVWTLPNGDELRFEAHPYFKPRGGKPVPDCERLPHWQIDGNPGKWMPGEPIPPGLLE